MSTLSMVLGVGAVCLGVFLYIHFKVIPDLVNDTNDKAGNKKKMATYSWVNAVLFVSILICVGILGATRFWSSSETSAKDMGGNYGFLNRYSSW